MNDLFLLVATDNTPDASSKGSTYEWTNDEDPKLLEGSATLEESWTDGTGWVDRSAGVTDAYEVNQDERQADGKTSQIASTLLSVGRAKNNENEDHGENNLSEEAAHDAYTILASIGASALQTVDTTSHGCEYGSCEYSTDNLEYHIHASVLTRDTLGEEAAEGDSWVDVAARNAADGISHSNNRETEGYRGADDGLRIEICTAKADGSTAAKKGEHEGADHFSKILFHTH